MERAERERVGGWGGEGGKMVEGGRLTISHCKM